MGFREVFHKPTTLLVVIHAEQTDQVLRNAKRAFEAGAEGVFLINHTISDAELLECYRAVRAAAPAAWVGISFMLLSASQSLELVPPCASGLWVSDAGTLEQGPQPREVAGFRAARERRGWHGLYFGGVAFKHQRPVLDPAAAAQAAAPYVDVITTSGSATGIAAPLEKIAAMKRAIGNHPLAVASGISPENVTSFLGLADCLLVATGVSESESELSPTKLARLVAAMRRGGWNPDGSVSNCEAGETSSAIAPIRGLPHRRIAHVETGEPPSAPTATPSWLSVFAREPRREADRFNV